MSDQPKITPTQARVALKLWRHTQIPGEDMPECVDLWLKLREIAGETS